MKKDTLNNEKDSIAGQIKGVAISLAYISANYKITNLNISGVYLNTNNYNGVALAPYVNTKVMHGLSIGVFNRSRNLHGVQLGLINYAGNNSPLFRCVPLINFHFSK